MSIKKFESQIIREQFPEINRIYIGGCGINGPHAAKADMERIWRPRAHTHMCNRSKTYRVICMTENMTFNKDGNVSDLLWHEYVHVMDTELPKNISRCYGIENKHDVVGGWDEHGPTYRKVLDSLNLDYNNIMYPAWEI